MTNENNTLPSGARKESVLVGLFMGLVALVLSVYCLGVSAQAAYADSQSSVGTPASSEATGISAMAETDEAVAVLNVSGTNNQTEARKILDMVNEARVSAATPVAALTWDYELEKAAMQRAAEIAILFSHDRPNGKTCFSLFSNGYLDYGENIHVSTGVSNATTANEAWTNSEGHYKNMVDGGFTCMAAAMFEVDGVTYWVELFANPNQGVAETAAVNGEQTYQIDALPDNLDLSFVDGLAENAAQGSKAQYWVMNRNKEWSYATATIDQDSFNWSSSNEEVASIDAQGVATVNGDGEVTITAQNKALASVAVSEKLTIKAGSSSAGATQVKEGWVHGSKGWWYRFSDGSYATGWFYDGKAEYYLDDNGWMMTGWQQIDGDWYYFKSSGAMTTGWQKVKGKWYFMDEDGIMLTGKITDKGKTYFLAESGAMRTGWVQDGSDWYYCNSSGAAVTGWQKVKGTWYFLKTDGKMATGWLSDKGTTYYLKSSGAMSTGWQQINNTWYYFKSSGAMTTGWAKVKNKWYYLNLTDGKMLTGKQVIDEKTYFLTDSGAMKTGWNLEGDNWYYYNKSGAMLTNAWISGKYWVGEDGVMATDSWVDDGKYWVDSEGKYVANKKPEATTPSEPDSDTATS